MFFFMEKLNLSISIWIQAFSLAPPQVEWVEIRPSTAGDSKYAAGGGLRSAMVCCIDNFLGYQLWPRPGMILTIIIDQWWADYNPNDIPKWCYQWSWLPCRHHCRLQLRFRGLLQRLPELVGWIFDPWRQRHSVSGGDLEDLALETICGSFSIGFPLVNIQKTMERSTMLSMGKSTISMAIFSIANC